MLLLTARMKQLAPEGTVTCHGGGGIGFPPITLHFHRLKRASQNKACLFHQSVMNTVPSTAFFFITYIRLF